MTGEMFPQSDSARRFRLERVSASAHGNMNAHLYAKRGEAWVIVGVMQLSEDEWTALASLYQEAGVQVSAEAKP